MIDRATPLLRRLSLLRDLELAYAREGMDYSRVAARISYIEQCLAAIYAEEEESWGLGFSLMDWLILAGFLVILYSLL